MSRIAIPSSIEASPAASQPMLEAVKKQLASVPNLFRLLGNSPAALEGYLGLSGALAKGAIGVKTRQRLALVVAERNGCEYCLSAHTYLGHNVAKLDEAELRLARGGHSRDPKADAALQFAQAVLEARGHVSDETLARARSAGHSDAELVEIVLHVALNTLTNYANSVAATEIDFPRVSLRADASPSP